MNIDKIDLIENQWGLFFVLFFIKQEETPSFLTSLWMCEDGVFFESRGTVRLLARLSTFYAATQR